MTPGNSFIRREAAILAGLTLAVLAVSAWLRLHGAGLGCEEWPICYGRKLFFGDYRPPAIARGIHRLAATLALLITMHLAWLAWKSRPRPAWARPVFVLLGLMFLLAAVGAWSHDPRNATVNLVNLLGGLLLVPISWHIVTVASVGHDAVPRRHRSFPVVMGATVLLAAVMLGAWIGASHSAVDSSVAGQALHWFHRGLALLAFAMLGHAAWRRSPARLAHALLALLAIEMALGLLLVIGDLPLLIAVAHNLTAAMLLAVTWQLSRESGTQGLPPLADDKRLD